MVELLVYKGAQINAQNESGKTAIMLAAFSGKLNVLKELRSNGASYDIKDRSGCSALHYAVDGGNLDCIQYLLMDGLDVNIKDTTSCWTPLIRAASVGASKDVAELLIKYKADINIVDKDNKNALMIAVINGNQPFVQCLVENGADLNITNEYGKTAYEMAVAMDRRRVVKYFDEYFEKQKG
ncbi:fibronectin type 3 and ankyrin repeat domains 1 [Brachionus plicatilis]|uniref:Fibronectin type 3 and ankyrin repeat domains 1 n=1 Tax=Brachionus plicatilis TaxID=10195 RepID=A0A3M7P9C8_BRAPC|nr:fibronectin type 3 and ankyrin repeat domains 1 [Brachionus plicatilis]